MQRNDRRRFLGNVGSGMLVGSLGVSLSGDLGISMAHAGEVDNRLTFGKMEPLVSLMQETPLDRLQRVSASEYGTTAPGYREACGLLGVDA